MDHYRKWYLLIGVVALLVGVLYYTRCRQEPPALLGWLTGGVSQDGCRDLPYAANSLPTFVHVLGFSLISGVFVGRSPVLLLGCALFWCFINVLFEMLALLLATEAGLEFMTLGEFDPLDILAAFAGALCALFIMFAITHNLNQSGRIMK